MHCNQLPSQKPQTKHGTIKRVHQKPTKTLKNMLFRRAFSVMKTGNWEVGYWDSPARKRRPNEIVISEPVIEYWYKCLPLSVPFVYRSFGTSCPFSHFVCFPLLLSIFPPLMPPFTHSQWADGGEWKMRHLFLGPLAGIL